VGLTYGIVLTVARTLGEYGAVIMVSSNLPGKSQTLTLLVSDRYNRGAEYGAYAISTLLMAVAVLVSSSRSCSMPGAHGRSSSQQGVKLA
jgi:sulfate transport system permease protein